MGVEEEGGEEKEVGEVERFFGGGVGWREEEVG